MPRDHLTRRQALRAGVAAAALGALRPATAFGSRRAASFSLPLDAPDAVVAGWRSTRVYAAPRRFDVIGLGWARGTRVDAQVRTRKRGGGWTRWTPLHPAHDHGPDGGGAVAGSDPVWTGAADEFQLRLRGHARGLEARFVHAAPGVPRRARLAARRARQGAPAIVPRSAWGGNAVIPRSAPAFGQVQVAFVHHTVNANDYGPEDSAAMVLGIARYHRDHNRWNDLGYNFVVDRYGQVFEGRAGGVDLAIVGAQAEGFNSVSTGIACLGTHSSAPLPSVALDALARLIGWKLSIHAVPATGEVDVTSAGGSTNRFPAGRSVTLQRISGHRDGNSTECPGGALYAQLEDLRARAARYAAPVAGLTVRASTTTVRGAVPTTIGGTLRFADGSSALGARVELLYATAGGAGAVLASATCAADGRWGVEVMLPATGTVRARFAGDATRPALESQDVDITVLPRIGLTTSATHLRRRRLLRIRGYVSPAPSTARMTWERKVGGRYRRVLRRTLVLPGGAFRTSLRPAKPGLYRVTISVPGSTERRYVRIR